MGIVTMKMLLVLLLVGLVASQDTYKCPDGWFLEEDRTGCRCFLIGPDEAVTRSTADLICAGHSGSWVSEFWLGGRAEGRHSEHQPGTWTWDHMNETISWFDWADGQPNNYDHQQMCLTLREYHDPFFPIARDYFWNDETCDRAAHFICENRCAAF